MDKQHLFTDEYLKDINAKRAYISVYKHVKKENTEVVNASKLLRNTKVKSYVQNRFLETSDEK